VLGKPKVTVKPETWGFALKKESQVVALTANLWVFTFKIITTNGAHLLEH
jgi:hypothetical protein